MGRYTAYLFCIPQGNRAQALLRRFNMKAGIYVTLFTAAVAVVMMTGNCATRKKVISDEAFAKVWSGTWISAERNVRGVNFQKAVFHPDGSYDYYYEIRDTIFHDTTRFTFQEKWTDSEGNIWYRAQWENSHYVEGYSIGKFSNSGNTYEEVWQFGEEAIEKWVPDDIRYFYWIWHRRK
jgi:hypothetical protein